ncbi:MAG: ABC transporter ATP-binding protein [Candidatus Fermentibacteraceae bacterium]
MGNTSASLSNVTVLYGRVKALDGFDLDIPSRGVHGLLGRNGAGKTTAIRALLGLLRLDGGSACVLGADPVKTPETRRRISVLFSEDGLVPALTVKENLRVWCGFYGCGPGDSADLTTGSLEAFGMLHAADKPVKDLSTGNRRVVAMARVFAVPSELVLLDEPTASLDPVKASEVRAMMKDCAGDRPVLLSTHNMSEAESICESITMMHRGKRVLHGETGALTVSSGFLVRTRGGAVVHRGEVISPGPDGAVVVESPLPASELLESLIAQGNRVEEFRKAGRNLEDVFMSLAREEGE